MGKEKPKVSAAVVMQETDKKERDKLYNKYVKDMTPKHNGFYNICKAYIAGGLICVLGQILQNFYMGQGAKEELASSYTTLSLIVLAVLFTGFNVYQKLAKWAGAGSVVPITGFANSVAAPAIEFKKEGQVFGIGTRIFSIAGPVILYGIFASFVLGFVYWLGKIIGWW